VQLARRLRDAIESGALQAGAKMLGSRELAKRLALGRNTVALAYEQLTAEGYLETRSGAGTYVATSGFGSTVRHAERGAPAPERAANIAGLRTHFVAAAGNGPLRPGMPSLAHFPSRTWSRLARRALDVYERGIGYEASSGTRELREAIAAHVRQFRGIAAQADQIIVLEGAQAAMHLAALVLAKTGDSIAIEDPCYAMARAVFELHELRLRAVPVDRDGVRTDALPGDARFAFVTPTHQFPLGGTLPLARRLQLLAWARERDAYVLEDDYDSEFTAQGRPLPALQSLDREERVIYIGSFSKTVAPGLRAGYLIAPPHLASAFRAARATTSLGLSLHLQATLAAFVAGGHFARHIRRMNVLYESRRTILAQSLEPLLRKGFEIGPMQVGLHLALLGQHRFDDAAAARRAESEKLVALSTLCLERTDCRGFALGFTNGSEAEIAASARRLVASLGGSIILC
jgi:GntR family transcriptional regulator / MocR family aminotransferase